MSNDLDFLARQRAGLPTFPGLTLPEQLTNAKAEAEARLRKYVANYTYSVDVADAVIHKVKSWSERNSAELQTYLADSTKNDLPELLQLQLGKAEAQQFVIATYSLAATGLGPWLSGVVASKVSGQEVPEPKMIEDADARLSIFASIVKWDNEGDLATIFAPDQSLGAIQPIIQAGIIIALAIVAVAGAAIVLRWVTSSKIVSLNAEMLDGWCKEAQKKGDQATVNKCIEVSAGLQSKALDQGDPISTAVKGALVLGGLYLFFVYGLPELQRMLPKKWGGKASEATA